MVQQQCGSPEPVYYAREIDRLKHRHSSQRKTILCTMLMKEYRICMPLTVDEVSVFVFPTLTHRNTHTHTHINCSPITLSNKGKGFIIDVNLMFPLALLKVFMH